MERNPQAADLDPRWPLDAIDFVYVKKDPDGLWALRDFFGDVIIRTDNRSVCYFTAMQHNCPVAMIN